jgi:hypothetical protein
LAMAISDVTNVRSNAVAKYRKRFQRPIRLLPLPAG